MDPNALLVALGKGNDSNIVISPDLEFQMPVMTVMFEVLSEVVC